MFEREGVLNLKKKYLDRKGLDDPAVITRLTHNLILDKYIYSCSAYAVVSWKLKCRFQYFVNHSLHKRFLILLIDMPSVVEVSQPVAVATAPQPMKQYVPQMTQFSSMEKTNYHGIEVINEIVWQGWEPGREYTKNIVLKNVNVKTQKIKYK